MLRLPGWDLLVDMAMGRGGHEELVEVGAYFEDGVNRVS